MLHTKPLVLKLAASNIISGECLACNHNQVPKGAARECPTHSRMESTL